MFSRRKRAGSTPHTGPPKSTAATTAAAQAFLAQRALNANLSSAAAAAALRSHTTSPVPVGDVQTKRMLRRGSISSTGSAPAGFRSGPTLRRQGSSGSMSERTFRDQSPSRSSIQGVRGDEPPVPAVPKQYAKGLRRPMSTEPPPARVSSPPPALPGGRGVSLDRGPGMLTGKAKKAQKPPLLEETSEPSDGRRGSINFSRPISPQNTPPVSPTQARHTNANVAANLAVLSAAERSNIEHAINEAASAPVKKKKGTGSRLNEGVRLAMGHSAAKPVGTAVGTDSDLSDPEPTRVTPQKARNGLSKQPSVVREDREREEREDIGAQSSKAANSLSQNGSTAVAQGKRVATKKTQVPETPPKPKPAISAIENDSQASKRASPSPARQAHFAAQPILTTPATPKHQPPGRSASPVKSALKHSPSPRGPSPAGHAPSEMSDDVSQASEEGLRPKRRSVVRVSFDDEPVIVGQSAQSGSPISPMVASPQDKSHKRGWFAFGKDKSKHQVSAAPDDVDDVIQPVPTLPSFGSIRGPKKETASSKSTSSARESESGSTDLGHSSDHAVGGIIHESKSAPGQNEERDDLSESELSTSDGEALPKTQGESNVLQTKAVEPKEALISPEASKPVDDTEPPTSETGEPEDHTTAHVPAIAVQPATPGADSLDEARRDSWLGMPGGFPKESSSTSSSVETPPVETPELPPVLADTKPSEVGIAEPEPEEAAIQQDPSLPVVGQVAATIREQTTILEESEESDGNGSVYGDANEDQSDLDGDGFGSINAIIESPVASEKKEKQPQEPPLTPPPRSKRRLQKSPVAEEPAKGEDWDKAQSYWSGLSSTRKAELEEEARQEAIRKEIQKIQAASAKATKPKQPGSQVANGQASTSAPVSKPKPKPKVADPPPTTTEPVTKTAARKPSLKKSMRDNNSATDLTTSGQQPTMRSTMRGPAPPAAESQRRANSTREGPKRVSAGPQLSTNDVTVLPPAPPRGILQKKQRPMSSAIEPQQLSGTNAGIRARPASVAAPSASALKAKQAPPPKPALRRQMSNGSDSDSSFKRARRNRATEEGRYNMRRSMRAAAPARPRSMYESGMGARNSSKLSVRSLSPAGNSRRPGSMRMSLRQPMPEPERPKSPTLSLFGRKKSKSQAPPEPISARANGASNFKSRFVDSSDEEDGGPRTYQSRFEDSSDEEDASMQELTPVRGIPRRIDEGDSTELEDSDQERKPKPSKEKTSQQKPPPAPIEIPDHGTEGAALAAGTLQRSGSGRGRLSPPEKETEKKKKRSFFGNLGRRKDKASKVGKVDFESAARRDTKLERTKAERDAVADDNVTEAPTPSKSNTPVTTPTASPKSPKLQRSRVTSDTWPLPPPIPESPKAPVRPNTSDGTNGRPKLERGPSAVSSNTVKKKRFPMLRKAFGLKSS